MKNRGKPSEVIGKIGTSGYLTKTDSAAQRCLPWRHQWRTSTIALVVLDANVPVTRCLRCGKVKRRVR